MDYSRGLEGGETYRESGHFLFRDGHDRGTPMVNRVRSLGLRQFRANAGIYWCDSIQW